MPRSRLGQQLAAMAARHRAADALGIPVASVEAMDREELRAGLTRRGFLAGAASAVAGAVAIDALPAVSGRARAASAPRIVVVGAGIAGLSAALRLQDSGVSCRIYEANTRIGGRMYSNTTTWAQGQVSEWGGELIDSGHKTVQTLARRFNIGLDDLVQAEPSSAQPTYFFGGAYYPYATANNDFQAVHQAVTADLHSFTWPVTWDSQNAAGVALANLSLYDWIETRVPGGHGSNMGKLLDVAYNIEYGGDTRDQTSLNLIGLLGYQPSPGQFSIFGLSDEKYHMRGGNQQLPTAIAGALPAGTITTGWTLTKLTTNSNGTQTLTFTVGSVSKTVTADHTILAVPLGVLQTLDFTAAGFDARKTGQIAAMRMGSNAKLQLQFTNRLWNQTGPWPGVSSGESYADTGYQNTWDVTRAQPGSQGILVDYTGASTAGAYNPGTPFSDQSNPKVVAYAQTFLRQVEHVYPGITAAWTGRATLSAWPKNPYSWGAYSYWPTRYCQNYAGYEAVRQGNTHFAGEHCSIDFQGYMEGGAQEGQRAATEVLADYNLK
jgi:monoamine oxidase